VLIPNPFVVPIHTRPEQRRKERGTKGGDGESRGSTEGEGKATGGSALAEGAVPVAWQPHPDGAGRRRRGAEAATQVRGGATVNGGEHGRCSAPAVATRSTSGMEEGGGNGVMEEAVRGGRAPASSGLGAVMAERLGSLSSATRGVGGEVPGQLSGEDGGRRIGAGRADGPASRRAGARLW